MDNNKQLQEFVKNGYANVLKRKSKASILPNFLQCCNQNELVAEFGKKIGYSAEQLKTAPIESNLGLGCGNPTAIASIKKGESILDLGSGAGFDCFLAARETGESGKVIGVDFTPEMVEKARKNAAKGNFKQVEFKIGDIEDLPIEDNSIDLIISNCVINLSPHKQKVFNEAFRVAKPNGRLAISDIILLKDLPDYIKDSIEGHIACLAGAIRLDEYLHAIDAAGFDNITINSKSTFPIELLLQDPIAEKIIKDHQLTKTEIQDISDSIISVSISATKPLDEK